MKRLTGKLKGKELLYEHVWFSVEDDLCETYSYDYEADLYLEVTIYLREHVFLGIRIV